MKLRKRVAIGIIAAATLALLLNTSLEANRELINEREFIAESGYRYIGESIVSKEAYAEILDYTNHFSPLGYAKRLRVLDEDMVLIRYNFFSREYYPELMQVEMVRSLQTVPRLELLLKVTFWFVAPGMLFLIIIAWSAITKETEEK